MSEFEDNLWLAVVREHGDELARTAQTGHHRRASRPQLLAGTAAGLVAMAAAAALLFGASTSPAAFAVTRNPDGTVTVRLMQPSGIAGANAKLAAMGVRALIAAQTKAAPKLVCPGGTAPTITFDPASIPQRQVLFIASGQPEAGSAAMLTAHQAGGNGSGSTGSDNGSGTTGSDTPSDGGNQVVRTLGAGNIRTYSGAENHAARMYCP